jgi:ribulose 1,5-bisphosphate synthetase/thiazole synthase
MNIKTAAQDDATIDVVIVGAGSIGLAACDLQPGWA